MIRCHRREWDGDEVTEGLTLDRRQYAVMPQLVNQARDILNQLLPLGESGLVLFGAGLVLAVEFGEFVDDAGENDGPPFHCGRVPAPVRWISQHGSVLRTR